MRSLSPFWLKRDISTGSPLTLWKEFDSLFEDYAMNRLPAHDKEFSPATEIVETEKSYELSVDLPGLKKDEIKIEVLDRNLTLFGERKREEKFNEGQASRIEKSYGSFKRSFSLPMNADSEKIEAKYENGVLEVSIPKTESASSKKIAIQ